MQTVIVISALLAGLIVVAALVRVVFGCLRTVIVHPSPPPPPPLRLVRPEPAQAYRSTGRAAA